MRNSKKQEWIREALKLTLKKQGLKYADLARALDVSVPTVARFMSKESLSLERLSAICDCLNLDLYELMETARALEKKEKSLLTVDQEMFLVRHPRYCRILIEVMNGLSVDAISRELGLRIAVVENSLNELKKQGLVTQTASGAHKVVKEVLQGPRLDGPLRQDLVRRFKRVVPRLIEKEFDKQSSSFPFQSVPTPENSIAVGSMGLTAEAQAELYRTLHEVWIKFTELERFQAQTISSSLLKPVTFMTLLCPGSIYALAYDEK